MCTWLQIAETHAKRLLFTRFQIKDIVVAGILAVFSLGIKAEEDDVAGVSACIQVGDVDGEKCIAVAARRLEFIGQVLPFCPLGFALCDGDRLCKGNGDVVVRYSHAGMLMADIPM